MIWISRIWGFAAQTPAPLHCTTQTSLPLVYNTDTTAPHKVARLLQPGAALHCLLWFALYCTLSVIATGCTRLWHRLQSCLPVGGQQYLQYLLHILGICCLYVLEFAQHQVFAASVSVSNCCLRATVQCGRPLTCPGRVAAVAVVLCGNWIFMKLPQKLGTIRVARSRALQIPLQMYLQGGGQYLLQVAKEKVRPAETDWNLDKIPNTGQSVCCHDADALSTASHNTSTTCWAAQCPSGIWIQQMMQCFAKRRAP